MKICLDAGHFGKYNRSPADGRYYESTAMWKLTQLQKKYLQEYGVEVITTRANQDADRPLYDRGAASAGCDLFISNHSNAVGSGINNQVDYPVAYCAINGSADRIGLALAQTVEVVMETNQSARIEHRRGQNGDYYGVVRGATAAGTPGLILEHSFHTNREMTEWLLNDDNLDRLAKAEADTIALVYGLILPEKKSGWFEEDGGWHFYLGDTGQYVTNDWYQDDEDWYWFDAAGLMIHDTWKTAEDGTWHYLQSDGRMAKNKWIVWKDELYRVVEDGSVFQGDMYLHAGSDGALQLSAVMD